jgi:hypothetical protein
MQVTSLEAQLAQSKSSASHYQQLAQQTQTSLDEARQSLAEAEESLIEARRQIKAAATAAASQQQQQHGYAGVQQSSSTAQQQQQLQQRCELLEMQLGKLQEEQRAYRSTTEVMMEAKDNELLAALRKNATLTEELSQLRQQQQQLQQLQRLDTPSMGASRGANNDEFGSGADIFGVVSAGVTGTGVGDQGSGLNASSVTGSMMQSRHGGGSLMQGVLGSQQLLGSYIASEPGMSRCGSCRCVGVCTCANAYSCMPLLV